MRISYDNLIKEAAITVSSENISFPSSNIKDFHLSKLFKFTGNSGEYIDLDLGSIENVRSVIFDTNITDGGTVNLYGNASSDFTTPDYTTTMDIYDGKVVKFLSENYRYWR